MGILDIFRLNWKPREGKTYRYRLWHRRKNLIWHPVAQGLDPVPEGTRRQNMTKVYVVIDEKPYPGTFRVSNGVCTLGLIKGKHISRLFSTEVTNIKFYKKYKGTSRVHPRFGMTLNITHHYEYVAKVLDSTKLIKEIPPKQIVRRRGTAIIDTPRGILVVAGRKGIFMLPGGGAKKGESREKAVIREVREETGLKAVRSKYLFSYNDSPDRKIRNLHKVFLLEVTGKAKPDRHEVKQIRYWHSGSDVNISNTAELLIQRYIDEFKI